VFAGFFLVFIGIPIGLAVLLGAVFPRKPIQAGAASIFILVVVLLAVNWRQGILAMLPFTLLVVAMAIVPAFLSAYFGAGLRLRYKKEN
jgi:hypothetical protein